MRNDWEGPEAHMLALKSLSSEWYLGNYMGRRLPGTKTKQMQWIEYLMASSFMILQGSVIIHCLEYSDYFFILKTLILVKNKQNENLLQKECNDLINGTLFDMVSHW